MVQLLVGTVGMNGPRVEHLQPAEVAAFVDGAVSGEVRALLVAHLASCAECRIEVADVVRIQRAIQRSRRPTLRQWMPAAAVAAAALVLLTRPNATRFHESEHREAPIATTVAPRAIEPNGVVDSAFVLRWSSVPAADRYLVRVFDAEGRVIWEQTTTDTLAGMPASVRLTPGLRFFWKVEAGRGGRFTSTELIEFSVRRARGP